MSRALYIDAQAGASGDMLLGALIDLGAGVDALSTGLRTLSGALGGLHVETVRRAGLRATRCVVEAPRGDTAVRNLGDVRALLERADLPPTVTGRALDVFGTLARAEAMVHGVPVDDVHFHEVGAWDSLTDVVGSLLALHGLGLLESDICASAVAVGSGTVTGAHGVLPVPTPATLAVLTAAGAPVHAGAAVHEACTPTGAALLATLASRWGPVPPMRPLAIGTGAGGRDTATGPNVLRLVVGEPLDRPAPRTDDLRTVTATVDDLDPRLWPDVLERIVAAGAHDAWLTAVVMRKGRPGHVVTAIAPPHLAGAVETALFAATSTLGVRHTTGTRTALPRRSVTVEVDGQPVSVKIAELHGAVVTVQPEFADAGRAADATGMSVRDVLHRAEQLARDAL